MPTMEVLLLLLGIALVAGWLDAVVGGGGLIQVPSLLILLPAAVPADVVGTSKLAALMGTLYAIYRFRASENFSTGFQLSVGFSLRFGVVTAIGGAVGALGLRMLPERAFVILLTCALIGVSIILLMRPKSLYRTEPDVTRRASTGALIAAALFLGLYDGLVGPGTGTFIVIALGMLAGFTLVQSSANAKIVNAVTYVGPLVVLGISGHVMWALALLMGVANVVGAHFGVKMALGSSTRVIRGVLFGAVALLALRLLYATFV